MQNLLHEKELYMQDRESVWGTNFHLHCFAGRLVLKHIQKTTRKKLITWVNFKTPNYLAVTILYCGMHRMAATIKLD